MTRDMDTDYLIGDRKLLLLYRNFALTAIMLLEYGFSKHSIDKPKKTLLGETTNLSVCKLTCLSAPRIQDNV